MLLERTPIEHLFGKLQWKVEASEVSNIHHLWAVVMEWQNRIQVENLWNFDEVCVQEWEGWKLNFTCGPRFDIFTSGGAHFYC